MPVNPFENRKDAKSSIAGIKNALLHLQKGHPLGIFPAGEVSTYKDGKLMVDKPWEEGAVKLIKNAEVPVIPIYFHAKNSRFFYFLSKISDTLRTAKLPSELLSQKDRRIKVRIGKPIAVKDQKQYQDVNALEKKQSILSKQNLKISTSPKKISSQKNIASLIKEVQTLRENDKRLLISKNYEVFLAPAKDIPNTLYEIGRLREITFVMWVKVPINLSI
jgi:1-acyl-sn-glycerol-3-phosphate acyltransferase